MLMKGEARKPDKQGSLPLRCKPEGLKKSSVKKMPTICYFEKQYVAAAREDEEIQLADQDVGK
eukprot:6834923-Ditylum_brightwellii.AAC.1